MLQLLVLCVFAIELLYIAGVDTKQGYGTGGAQDWGYIDVREGAHMFYWLHYTTATTNYTERPLIIWLQGGPGDSSAGIGNFDEIGPLDRDGIERNHTWVKDVNVLFIDNPVGSGFSYVDDTEYLATSLQQIAKDLITFMKVFYKKHADFEHVPLHIFGESFGGKMAAKFALELYYATEKKELISLLKSVVLVSPGISAEDQILAFAPLLLTMGVIDNAEYKKIMEFANKTKQLIDAEQWIEAFYQADKTLDLVKCIDLYNIARPKECNNTENYILDDIILEELMQGAVSKNLSIPSNIKWGYQWIKTLLSLRDVFMMPDILMVSELLEKTDLQIGIVAGQFDVIIPLAATVNWINKMEWSYKRQYMEASRKGIKINGILEGHEKSAGRFSMFWIYRAGHMVPADNPKAMKYIMHKYTNYGEHVA